MMEDLNSTEVTITYILTEECNFKCKYCYEKKSNNESTSIINDEIFEIVNSFTLDNLMLSHDAISDFFPNSSLSITFFGGEPLLFKEIIIDFVKLVNSLYTHKGKIAPKFSVITNGSLLEPSISDFIIENFYGVTISIDGTKEIHDYYRRNNKDEGTYDIIKNNLDYFIEKNNNSKKIKTAIEVTVTDAYAHYFTNDLIIEIWETFKKINIPLIDFIPVEGEIYSLFKYCLENKLSYDHDIINQLVDCWFSDLIEGNLTMNVISFHSILLSLLKNTKSKVCSAGINYFSITPDLSIYSCQVAKFNSEKPIGEIFQSKGLSLVKKQILEKDKMVTCSKCDCFNGCTAFCRAVWESKNPQNLLDQCKWQIIVRRRILENISILKKAGEMERFKKSIIQYYAK